MQALPREDAASDASSINSEKLREVEDQQRRVFEDLVDAEFATKYSNARLYAVFCNLLVCVILVNVDHGSLPASAEPVMKKLSINPFHAGLLGAVVFVGIIMGSCIGTKVYTTPSNIKPVLIVGTLFNGITLSAFAFSSQFGLSMLMRLATGFFQVFITIFGPVWADAFAPERFKTFWMSALLMCAPLGVFLGMTVAGVFVQHGMWEWAFHAQALVAVPTAIGLMMVPAEYLDTIESAKFKAESIRRVLHTLDLPEELKVRFLQEHQLTAVEAASVQASESNPDLDNTLNTTNEQHEAFVKYVKARNEKLVKKSK